MLGDPEPVVAESVGIFGSLESMSQSGGVGVSAPGSGSVEQ